jgi:ketosteroid isomerase-like protein
VSASLATSDGGDSPQADQNRQVVNRFFTALTEGRYRDAEEQVMPEATWWMLAKRECIDAVVWLAGFAKAFPDGLMFELEDSTSEGSRIAVRALARGVTSAGRDFDNAYHFLFQIRAGLIQAAWEYGDTLHAERVFRG